MATSSYKISSYAKFLLKLACQLKPEDLDGVKLVLAVEERVWSGKLEGIKTAAELFVQLQHIGLLGPRNVSFFEEVFPDIGRADLLPVISDFKQLWETPNEIPVPEITATEHALINADWEMRDVAENEVFGDFDDQSQCSSRSRLSSLSDDEKLDIAKRKKKKVKPKAAKSRTVSQSSLSKLLSKLKL